MFPTTFDGTTKQALLLHEKTKQADQADQISTQTCRADVDSHSFAKVRGGGLTGPLVLPPGSEPSGSAGQMNQVTGLTKAVRIIAPTMSTPVVKHTVGHSYAKANQTVITSTFACPCV